MTQPTRYTQQNDFSDQLTTTAVPSTHGLHLDQDLARVKQTTDQIITNLGIIQRDDTALRNGVVHPDSLSAATKAMIGAGRTGQTNWLPRGAWVTATAYAIGDVVETSGVSYVSAVAHTSAALFATDLAAGQWVTIANNTADTIAYVPTAPTAIATTVRAALRRTVHFDDFGAVGDGTSHPLSEFYSTLAAAQAQFPHAVALTDEIDWAAAQAAINWLAPTAGSAANGVLKGRPGASYLANRPIVPKGSGLIMRGEGALITATAVGMEAILDCGNTFVSGNNQSCQYDDFHFNLASKAYYGIKTQQGTDVSIRNIRVNNWLRAGAIIDGRVIKQAKNIMFDSCTFFGSDNATGYAVHIIESGVGIINNFTLFGLLNCETLNGDTAVRIESENFPIRLKILLGAYQNNASYVVHAIGLGSGGLGAANAPHVSVDTLHLESGGLGLGAKLEGGAKLYTHNTEGLLSANVQMDAASRWYPGDAITRDVAGNLTMNAVEIVGSSPPSVRATVNDGFYGEFLAGQSATTSAAARMGLSRCGDFRDAMFSQNLRGVASANTYQTIETGSYAAMETFYEDVNKRGVRWIVSAAAQTAATPFTPTYAMTLSSAGALTITGGLTTAGGSLSAAGALLITGSITTTGGVLHATNSALTNGAAAATGTLTNAPAAGNPTKWVPINDNGTTRYIPAW